MSILFFLLLASGVALAQTPPIGSTATITMVGGEKMVGKVVRIDPDSVSLLTHDGGSRINFFSMTPEERKRWGYDPDKAAEFLAEQETQKEAEKQKRASVLGAGSADAESGSSASDDGWAKVASFSGSTTKNTEPFTVSGERWRVRWTCKASAAANELMGSAGQGSAEKYAGLMVTAIRENGNRDTLDVVSQLLGGGSDSTELRGAGTYHFEVHSANSDWTLIVEQYEK
jgi:hypothetical protein